MDNKVTADDYSLLERALSLSSMRAQTLESLSAGLGETVEDASLYWFAANKLRRSQGRYLPTPYDAPLDERGEQQCPSDSWYSQTWRLGRLLERFQINEALAVPYADILTDPEGGHYELNLAASEVVLAVCFENVSLDKQRMKRVCVHACEPTNGIELLVSNAGKILLSVEDYRDKPITAAFIEGLYARLVEGISIKEVSEVEEHDANTVEDLRKKALDSFCCCLWPREGGAAELGFDGADCRHLGDCGNHSLVNALIALHYFKTFRLFPAGNNVLAYLLYFLILHREGYHFSAHVPVFKLLYACDEAGDPRAGLPCDPDELAVECGGYRDLTRFFEQAVEAIVDEQRWTMTKLDGMSRRRERFRIIIDSDETMNFRQKEVLLEAILHSNAEFTYGIHEQRYDVSYPCARSDFARLLDMGFLRQHDDGIRHFFVAADGFGQTFLEYLKNHCSPAFYRYYNEDGSLRSEYRSAEAASHAFNRDIGFYEKSLLDKTYIEHHDFRRAPIADCDGPRRRSCLGDG